MEAHGRSKDHNFAFAFLLAAENMDENGIDISNPTVFQLVSEMTLPESGYIQVVREKALEVLRSMK